MLPDRRQRLKRLLLSGAGLLCAGLFYGLVLAPLGLMVPCVFHLVTGLNCPGCGVSRMCVSFLHMRILEGIRFNYGLAACAPGILYLLGSMTFRYVKSGSARLMPWEERLCMGLIAAMVVWGIARNFLGL